MSKAKFEAAKELIAEHRYNEARVLLRTIGHPTAENWLRKLDELDPPGAKSTPSVMPSPADYEPILRRWVEVEKTLHVLGALFMVLGAAYLFIADPLREPATFLLFDKPQARDVVLLLIPTSLVGFAGYVVWRSTQDNVMRRFVLKQKPSTMFLSMWMALISIPFLVLPSLVLRSTILESTNLHNILIASLMLLVAVMARWRGLQARAIRQLGYLDPDRSRRNASSKL